MDQYIFTLLTGTQSCINGIVTFLSTWNYGCYFCETIFFYNFLFTVRDRFFPCHKDNLMDQRAVLKTAQGIIQDRMPCISRNCFCILLCILFPCPAARTMAVFFPAILTFSQFQIRNCIQIPSMACSFNIFIISRYSDHCRIIGTENRRRTVEAVIVLFAGFFHCRS